MARGQHGAENRGQHAQTTGPLELRDAAGLLACRDPDELLRTAQDLALRSPRYTRPEQPRAFLYQLRPDGWLQLSHLHGLDPDKLAPYRLVAPDAYLPVAQAVRDGKPVFSVLEETDTPAPEPEKQPRPATYATFPLHLESDCLGAVIFCLPAALRPEDQRPDAEEYTRLESIATLVAHRLHLVDRGYGGSGPESGEAGRPGHSRPPASMRRRGPLVGYPTRLESVAGWEPGQRRSNLDPMVEMALSNAGVGAFDWDFASGRLVWDELHCQIFDIHPETFDGRIETYFEAIHPDDVPQVRQAVEDSHRTGYYTADYRIVLTDGTIRHVRGESRVVFTPQGEPAGMVGITRDRTSEVKRAAAGKQRRDFVLRVTQAFTAAATTDEVISVMTETVMPVIPAYQMAIFLTTPREDVRLAGSYGYTEDEADQLLAAVLEVGGRGGALSAYTDGRPLFLENREQYLEAIPDPRLAPKPRNRSWLVMPLATADGLVGSCLLTYDRPQTFNAEDQILATGIASILAQSLARTRLFDERRAQLTDLQRMMLPERLPGLPGLDIAVGYRPGSEGLMVGGDWYDALEMPDGSVAVVIGDVQGHSAQAAAVMGQLRTVMQTCAAEGHRLNDLLTRSNRFLHQMDTDLFATCAIVEIDVESGRVQLARAGHPYPMVVDAEGRVREVETPGAMPLGCFPEDDYPVYDLELGENDTLLLFTDGLVENTGRRYDEAVAELTEQLGYWATDIHRRRGTRQENLERLAEEIITPTVVRPKLDDVAVLLVRRVPLGKRPTGTSRERGSGAEPGSRAGWDAIAG